MPSPTPAKRTGTSRDQEATQNNWSDEGWTKIFPPLREEDMRQLLVGEGCANEGLSHTSASLDLHRCGTVSRDAGIHFLWRFAGNEKGLRKALHARGISGVSRPLLHVLLQHTRRVRK